MRAARQRQRLHRKHRQHARHDVEDEPAQKCERQRRQQRRQRQRRNRGGRRRAAGVGQWFAWLSADLVGAAPFSAIDHHHAIERRFAQIVRDACLQGEAHACFTHARRLRRCMIERIAVVRKEMRAAHRAKFGHRHTQSRRRSRCDTRRHRIAARWQRRHRLRNARRPRRIVAALGRNGQRKSQHAFLGNADIGTDQPKHVGRQGRCLSRPQVRWRGDLNRKQHFARVAVVHQDIERDRIRRRPLDRPRAPARRQAPVDLRRLAAIAGIAPISVPVLADVLAQHDREMLARRDGGARRRGIRFRHWRCEMVRPMPARKSPARRAHRR